MAPNHFVIRLAPDDHDRFQAVSDALVRELAGAARQHARDEGIGFLGPVGVDLVVDQALRTGRFEIDPAYSDTGGTASASARLVLPDGQEVPLGDSPLRIGRLPSCSIVLNDPNTSREHAEVVPDGDTYLIADLGSTNGTRVNGVPIQRHRLGDGDEITIGASTLRFAQL